MMLPNGSDDASHFVHQANPDVIGVLLVIAVIITIFALWERAK